VVELALVLGDRLVMFPANSRFVNPVGLNSKLSAKALKFREKLVI
jgi:hypothetical protein